MDRIYHTWDKWECYSAGFYDEHPPKGLSKDDCTEAYREFLADLPRFGAALKRVILEWHHSCEHYLSNINMNRIAWLGQSAMCVDSGIPACFRMGYNLLTKDQQAAADALALEFLNEWLKNKSEPELDFESAQSKTKANLY